MLGVRGSGFGVRAGAHLSVLARLHRGGVVGLIVADAAEYVVERADGLLLRARVRT